MSPANIIAGFRTCGVYPFNPNAISATPHTEHEDDTGTSVATSTSSSFYSHFRGDTDFYSHFRGDTENSIINGYQTYHLVNITSLCMMIQK